jgi:hypothetical protein
MLCLVKMVLNSSRENFTLKLLKKRKSYRRGSKKFCLDPQFKLLDNTLKPTYLISKKLSLAVGIPYNARKLYKVCTYISTVYVGGPMLQNKSVNLCIGLTLILESAYACLYSKQPQLTRFSQIKRLPKLYQGRSQSNAGMGDISLGM